VNIVAEIPARLGSKRVRKKNLRMLAGIPLIQYSIDAAKNSKLLTEVYVNSESEEIGELATKLGVSFYKRAESLSTDSATSDEFNYDFFKNTDADIVVMVNPVAPFVTGALIDEMIQHYNENQLDTLVAVKEERLHAFLDSQAINFDPGVQIRTTCDPGIPINFDPGEKLPATQNIAPIRICAWTVCIWRRVTFMSDFIEKGAGVFSGKVGLYVVSKIQSIKISTEEDFEFAEILMNGLNQNARKRGN
jgi:CMP-N,N'-diacetyllegionaminic acid synthase